MATISAQVRLYIYDRDKGICSVCGGSVKSTDASVDHETPVSIGGVDDISNYRLVHARCNSKKGKYLSTDPGPGPKRSTWTEEAVISEIERRRGSEISVVAREIVKWAHRRKLEFVFPTSSASGGIYFYTNYPGGKACIFALWGDSSAWLQFVGRNDRPSLDSIPRYESLPSRVEVVDALRAKVPGVAGIRSFKNPGGTAKTNPEIDLFFMLAPRSLRAFLQVYDRVLKEARAATS